jgi:hypothetical protein
MMISVRPVHRESENQEFLTILQANLPSLPHARRFKWLYCDNPDGPAWSWFALQGPPEQVIGVTSVFPRSMWVRGELQRCGQVGDFAVSASHRSLGPAVLLQRATLDPVNKGELAFCYDCPPHQAGMSTFRRLGIPPNCKVHRYAVPLRVDSQLRKRLGAAAVVPAAAGNLLLRLHRLSAPKTKAKNLEVSDHQGAFGEEFSKLDEAVKGPNTIRGRRNAALLNWRYRDNPLQQYEILTAKCKGELIAFAVIRITNEVVTIVDLFGTELHETAYALVAAIVERFQKSHQTVDVFLSEGSELVACFLKMRFKLRSEAAQVVAYAKPQSEVSEFLQKNPTWSFHQAEIGA